MSKNRLLAPPENTPGQRFVADEKAPLSVPTLDGGMNTKTDSADLENNEFVIAQNVYIRNNKITRRTGTSLLTPTKPNSEAVKKLFTFKQYDSTNIQLRFSETEIHRRGSGSWTEIIAAGTPISSPVNNVIAADNRVFFTNNGAQNIQEIDFGADTYDNLGNAPRYKYITGFYNRIIGAYLVDGGGDIPIQLGWSGDFDFGEWDTSVNPSAGFAPLEESQSDYADFITSINGFATQMIITREQSIWLANKIPGTNPFYFFAAVPSVGCDMPTTVQKIPKGIAFCDRKTNSIYTYTLNDSGYGELKNIGWEIEDSLFSSISNPDDVFSGFDPVQLEYRVCCPIQSTNTVRCWTYSFKSSRGR